MRTLELFGTACLLSLALGLGACTPSEMDHKDAPADMHMAMWSGVTHAVAVLHSPKPADATIAGVIEFDQLSDGKVHVHGTITGLAPNTDHGFHIHEFGDIRSADGLSTGGHFNPEGAAHQHAGLDNPMRHAGDLGNVHADASGTATVDVTVDNISIAGMKDPIIGRGLVLHANPDDLKTQPTGNAGGRIAVAVIGIAK